MALRFREVSLRNMGGRTGEADLMWGELSLSFMDTDRNVVPMVDITLTLPRGADVTLAKLDAEARQRALTLLKAAVDCLERHSMDDLRNMENRE